MTDTDTELASQRVKLKKNGDLVQENEGVERVVAHYDKESGHLEFATREDSVKLYQQVTAKIGSVNKGTQPSGNIIRSIGLIGEAKPSPSKVKRPKLGADGDAAYEQVKWYVDNDLPQAIIRYGIYTDAEGKPIRRHARMVMEETTDTRATVEDDDLPWVKKEKKSREKGPVAREVRIIEDKKAIIARRATNMGPEGEAPLTFTPAQVVGGFDVEDFDPADVAAED